MFDENNKPHKAIRYAVTREFLKSGLPVHEICYTFNAEQAEEIAEVLALGAFKRGARDVQYNVKQTGVLFDDKVERQLNTQEFELRANCDTVFKPEEQHCCESVWWQEHAPYVTGLEDFTKEMKDFNYQEYCREKDK